MSTACGCGGQASSAAGLCSTVSGSSSHNARVSFADGVLARDLGEDLTGFVGVGSASRPGRERCLERDAMGSSGRVGQRLLAAYSLGLGQTIIVSSSLTGGNPLTKLDLGQFPNVEMRRSDRDHGQAA